MDSEDADTRPPRTRSPAPKRLRDHVTSRALRNNLICTEDWCQRAEVKALEADRAIRDVVELERKLREAEQARFAAEERARYTTNIDFYLRSYSTGHPVC